MIKMWLEFLLIYWSSP